MHVVRLLAPRVDDENHTKDVDFSPAGIRRRGQFKRAPTLVVQERGKDAGTVKLRPAHEGDGAGEADQGGRKSWAGLCQADALDAAHLCSLSPTASAHVHLRVVEAEGFDFDAFAFRLAHLFPSRSGPAESSSGSDRQSGVMRAPRCGTSVTR